MIKKFINKHALFLLLLAYFFFYLAFLQDVPIWWMDESWGSECAWNFAQTGIMGEVSFGTVYNINNYCFGIGSITHLLLISASFFLFGLGIFQARIVSVLLGAIVVFFVFKIAEKIFNDRKTTPPHVLYERLSTGFLFYDTNIRSVVFVHDLCHTSEFRIFKPSFDISQKNKVRDVTFFSIILLIVHGEYTPCLNYTKISRSSCRKGRIICL